MLNHDNETLLLINEKLSEIQLERVFALKALSVNPEILDNPVVFEKMVYVLNEIKPNFEAFNPPTTLQVAKAASMLGSRTWHPDIVKYIAHIAHEEGWVEMPSILSFANEELKSLHAGDYTLDEDQQKVQYLKHKAVELYLARSGA